MTTNPEVDRWLTESTHPLKELMQRVRRVILSADGRVEEGIKWQTPTFSFRGNIASINPQAKQFLSLMFHRGADIPGNFPNLEGGGKVARYMKFQDAGDLEAKSAELQAIVRAWCEMRAG